MTSTKNNAYRTHEPVRLRQGNFQFYVFLRCLRATGWDKLVQKQCLISQAQGKGSEAIKEVLGAKPWYAVRVNARYEFRTSSEMRSLGFEPFLPVRPVRKKWSDRIKIIEEPLFPNYLFCRFDEADRVKILRCAGVAQILGVGKTPLAVSEDEIRSIQMLVASKVLLSPHPFVRVGQRVCLTSGPLTGVEGTVVRHEDGRSRLVVSVTILQRAVAAEVDYEWIVPAAS